MSTVSSTIVPGASAAGTHPRTVCHLIASNFAGGPEKQILELSHRSRAIGWRVVVGSFRENRPSVDITDAAGARGFDTFLIDTRSSFSLRSVDQLVENLERFGVDVLVTHGYKANLVGHLAVRRTRTAHAATVRGYTAEDWKVRAYEILDRRILRRIPLIFCVSEATKAYLAGIGVSEHKLVMLPNAVEDGADVAPRDVRRELGFPEGSSLLVAAGRLSPEKGHAFLIDAMHKVVARQPATRLVIYGEGPERSELERQIAASGLSDHIVLAGFRRGVIDVLAGADLVVNPSLSEGLPNVVLEALSVCTPVVATDVGGVGELIIDGATGFLVPPGEAEALATGIAGVLENPARARALADAGHRHVLESYSFSCQLHRFTQACERLLQASRMELMS